MNQRSTLTVGFLLGLACLWVAPGADAAAKKKRTKARVQRVSKSAPELQYELFRRKVEVQVAEKREEQISGLYRLLELGPKEDDIPDIRFRLAELFYEKSRYLFLEAQALDDEIEKAGSGGAAASLKQEKKNRLEESKTWTQKAREIYRDLREKYPKYKRIPEVLFALGQSYWNDGKTEKAFHVYADLIRAHPKSALVPEAWLAIGEYYFDKRNIDKALRSYEKAAEDKRSSAYGFALYKQAWCYYNLSDWNAALRKFKATVFYSNLAEQLSGENRIALGREAQRDYVKTFAHIGRPEQAETQFAQLLSVDSCSDDQCSKLLELLAGLWYDGGFFDEAAAIYQRLIRIKPLNTRNPFYQGRIVDLVARGVQAKDKRRTVVETRKLVELQGRIREHVSRMGASATPEDQENVREAEIITESTVRKLAQTWNQEGRKTKSKETNEFAEAMYREYLKLFATSQFAYEMRFQWANLLYSLEKFDAAAQAFQETVEANPKGKYLIDAANDNILALEEHVKDLKIKPPKDTKEKRPIHPQMQRLIDACDRYVKFVPADKATEAVSVKFKAAKIFYDYNQFDEAVSRFDVLVMEYPRSKEAVTAANLVMDTYNLKKDWRALYETANKYLKSDELVKGREAFQADLRQFSEYAKFAMIQALEEEVKASDTQWDKVAKGYEEFYIEFPRSKNADRALFNASVAYDKIGEKAKADELRKQLLAEFKDSPLRADVAHYMAKASEERTQYRVAAQQYAAFYEQNPKDPRAKDALFNAGVFYAGTGGVEAANRLRAVYLDKYGKSNSEEATTIRFAMARDLERARKFREAADAYADFVKRHPRANQMWDALWNEAEIRAERLGQGSRAAKLKSTLLATYISRRRSGGSLPDQAALYASKVAFESPEQGWSQYMRMRIVPPNLRNPAPFQRSLTTMAVARDRLIGAYTKVVTDFQQAETTIAALLRIAQAWENFAKRLSEVPCPNGTPDDVCALIQQGIEEKAAPSRQTAFNAYKTCVDESNKLKTFTEYSRQCVQALEQLAPEQYLPMNERSVPIEEKHVAVRLESNSLILPGVAPKKQPAARKAAGKR